MKSEQSARQFFIKKSGDESVIQNYSPKISNFQKKLIFLPDSPEELYVYLPFLLYLAKTETENSLLLVASGKHRYILKAVGLQAYSYLYSSSHFRYGEKDFADLESYLEREAFDIALMLDSEYPLLKLYLCRKSQAPIRIGIRAADQYPFINISLSPSEASDDVYTNRHTLLKHFNLPEVELLEEAMHYVKGFIKGDDFTPQHSRNVILLNMETDLDGKDWSLSQLKTISESIGTKYRLLALFTQSNKSSPLKEEVQKMNIKIAPLPSSSGALLDMLRQYRALISRNSDHAHLCLNLGSLPTLMFLDEQTTRFSIPDSAFYQLTTHPDSEALSPDVMKKFMDSLGQ